MIRFPRQCSSKLIAIRIDFVCLTCLMVDVYQLCYPTTERSVPIGHDNKSKVVMANRKTRSGRLLPLRDIRQRALSTLCTLLSALFRFNLATTPSRQTEYTALDRLLVINRVNGLFSPIFVARLSIQFYRSITTKESKANHIQAQVCACLNWMMEILSEELRRIGA